MGCYRVAKLYMSNDDSGDGTAEPFKLIISGAPASGKGTQCELIKSTYGVVHLSTGDMLRAAVADGTEVGKLAQEYMDSGKLVPDDVIIGVVSDRLSQSDCQTSGWLLDGFPRTRAQADALAAAGVTADCFLFLNVPDDILVERVVGRRTDPETGKIYHMTFSPPESDEVKERLVQRSDDTEEKVKVRLEQFHDNVESVKGCYESISVEIDGTESVDVVGEKIRAAIEGCRATA
jgi:adenylate kinase